MQGPVQSLLQVSGDEVASNLRHCYRDFKTAIRMQCFVGIPTTLF